MFLGNISMGSSKIPGKKLAIPLMATNIPFIVVAISEDGKFAGVCSRIEQPPAEMPMTNAMREYPELSGIAGIGCCNFE